MAAEFYDVKLRKKVQLPEKDVMKTSFKLKTGQVRYAITGRTEDGRRLTKFVSKTDWDKMTYPVEKG
jgi:hypothetical protein